MKNETFNHANPQEQAVYYEGRKKERINESQPIEYNADHATRGRVLESEQPIKAKKRK